MYLTHFFSSNVITIVSHCCGFLEADRRNKLLQLTVLICHTEQVADSYYVNEIWREGYFSSWAIRVIESNRIRAQGTMQENRLLLWRAAHRLLEPQVSRFVQRLGKHFLWSKGPGFDQNIFSVRKMPWFMLPPLSCLLRCHHHGPLEVFPTGRRTQALCII